MIDASARAYAIDMSRPKTFWLARAVTLVIGIGLQCAGLYALVATFGAWSTLGLYSVGGLAIVLQHIVLRRITCSPGV